MWNVRPILHTTHKFCYLVISPILFQAEEKNDEEEETIEAEASVVEGGSVWPTSLMGSEIEFFFKNY